jgi:mRNA-degrading endonuclease RelE of RelBE toxin-antitoxin system
MFTFVETRLFSRLIHDYLSEEEYSNLQGHLAAWPESGDVVPGTGGVRKIRWVAKGRGKRGGVRVVYLARVAKEVIWLLTIYAKNEAESIPANVLRKMREELEQ